METVETSVLGEGAVLMVPSSFIPANEDISTESVLPLGTLTGNDVNQLSSGSVSALTICFSIQIPFYRTRKRDQTDPQEH